MGSDPTLDLEACRVRLEQRRTELLGVAAVMTQAARPVELDQARIGRVSRVDALQQQAMSKEFDRRRRLELQRIEAALKRIEDGDYGGCLSCGESIASQRLAVDPATPVCINCARSAKPR